MFNPSLKTIPDKKTFFKKIIDIYFFKEIIMKADIIS